MADPLVLDVAYFTSAFSSRRMQIYKHRIQIQSDNVNICTLSTVDLSPSLFKGAIKLNAHMNVATLLYLLTL